MAIDPFELLLDRVPVPEVGDLTRAGWRGALLSAQEERLRADPELRPSQAYDLAFPELKRTFIARTKRHDLLREYFDPGGVV